MGGDKSSQNMDLNENNSLNEDVESRIKGRKTVKGRQGHRSQLRKRF